MLKTTFFELLEKYTDNVSFVNELWTEIAQKYSESHRFYHTSEHLDNLLLQLTTIKNHIHNWDAVLFTLFYHDIIYNPQQTDNEEKSAELAVKRMTQLGISDEIIEVTKSQILATKSHVLTNNSDTNYFTDADLSILGQNWEIYFEYAQQVRKEYIVYPDSVYNPGRVNVLNHFLNMKSIFKTTYFSEKFEVQAKKNLQQEIELISFSNFS